MIVSARLVQSALAVLLGVALSGCLPGGRGQLDEEKEPHYQSGKSRVNSLDYAGAVESFEKALEVNPRSASAHLELGILYDQKEADPAAAIYHYSHYLKFRPEAVNSETVKQRIMACKQELARTVSLGPVTDRQQRDLEKMAEENKRLADEVRLLQEEVAKWRATSSNPPPAQVQSHSPPAGTTARPPGGTVTTRTHTVKKGETPSSIARQYGVQLDAFLSANPGVDPRRLRVGQNLNVPAR